MNIRLVGGAGGLSLLLRSAKEGPSRRINAQRSSSSIGADAGVPLGFVREFRYGRDMVDRRLKIKSRELWIGVTARLVSPSRLSKQNISSAAISATLIESCPFETICWTPLSAFPYCCSAYWWCEDRSTSHRSGSWALLNAAVAIVSCRMEGLSQA